MESSKYKAILTFLKEKGFIIPSSEIYGGISGIFDDGTYGTMIKSKLITLWEQLFIDYELVFPFSSAILTKEEVVAASGHLENFFDEMVTCQNCNFRFRIDIISLNNQGDKNNFFNCLNCKSTSLYKPTRFNLMFKTTQSANEQKKTFLYLRPETAQGIIINFSNIKRFLHKKLPFGIAQVGKSFRNEIAFSNGIFRIKEFQQMELEFFYDPKSDSTNWFEY
jgi:glycyl-tRNA synthetase